MPFLKVNQLTGSRTQKLSYANPNSHHWTKSCDSVPHVFITQVTVSISSPFKVAT